MFMGKTAKYNTREIHRQYYLVYAGSDSLLSEEDYEAHPELQMSPTMRGSSFIKHTKPCSVH